MILPKSFTHNGVTYYANAFVPDNSSYMFDGEVLLSYRKFKELHKQLFAPYKRTPVKGSLP